MIKNIIYCCSLMVLIIYWFFTILISFPNNYISISLIGESYRFQEIFPQRWNFFAPPPKFNTRLYYVLYDSLNNKIVQNEVLENISKDKQAGFLLNNKVEYIDYMINNNVMAILESMNVGNSYYRSQHKTPTATMIYKFVEENTNSQINAIFKFGLSAIDQKKIVAAQKIQIIVTAIDIPKFSDRHVNKKIVETVLIASEPKLIKEFEHGYR